MVGLYILLAVLLLVLSLLFAGIKLRIAYGPDFTLRLSFLGISVPLYPKKKAKIRLSTFSYKKHQKRLNTEAKKAEKKRLKQREKAKKKQQGAATKKQKKQLPTYGETVSDERSFLSTLLSLVIGVIDKFFGMIRIDVVDLNIVVGGPDAANTAITYGLVSQGIAYLLEILHLKTKLRWKRKEAVSVRADFLAEKTTASVTLVFTFRLWYFINIGFTLLTRYFKEKFRAEARKYEVTQ